MIVPLTGVANAQYVTVTVSNVASADGGTGAPVWHESRIPGRRRESKSRGVGGRPGPVNAQLAQQVTAANYLKDVNASGTLTVGDKGITNANLTTSLPAP
jgi:hypothetical protein